MHFNIILPSTLKSPMCSLSLMSQVLTTSPSVLRAYVPPCRPSIFVSFYDTVSVLGRSYKTDTTQQTNICLGIHRQTCMATFNMTCLSRLLATNGLLVLSLLFCDVNVTYKSDKWDEFLLIDSNLCLKFANRRRRWMHQLWEYFKLCKILTEFPDKFREYYRMNIKSFDYIM